MQTHRKAAAVAALCLTIGGAAQAQDRTFSRVAGSKQGFDAASFGAPAVNDAGQVAFRAQSTDFTVVSVQRGSGGGPLTTIADSNDDATGTPGNSVSINNAGQVAFWSSSPAGAEEGVFRGSGGGTLTTIATTGAGYPFNFIAVVPSLNDSGVVAFQAELDGAPFDEGLFTGNGGTPTAVFLNTTSPFTNSFASPSINRSGQIAFTAGTDAGPRGVFRHNPSDGSFTTIADDAGPLASFDDEPSLNNAGRVAFEAALESGTGGEEAILVGDGTAPAVVFVSTETSAAFGSFDGQSINDAGQIVFISTSDDFSSQAIYAGPDAIADRVIATGDALDGSTVASLSFFREGLNDAGQIAFAATLADGRGGIYLATLVPEPAAGGLLAAALTILLRRPRKG